MPVSDGAARALMAKARGGIGQDALEYVERSLLSVFE
jgi:hypothetical protein